VQWFELADRGATPSTFPDIEQLLKRYPETGNRPFVAKYHFYPTPPRRLVVGREQLSELYIREGDRLEVEGERRADGYYIATLNGKRGLAPAAHIESMDLSVERARPDVLSMLAMPSAPPHAAPRGGLHTYRAHAHRA
jgi:hypothetical protein